MQVIWGLGKGYVAARRWLAAGLCRFVGADHSTIWTHADLQPGQLPWELAVHRRCTVALRSCIIGVELILFMSLVILAWQVIPQHMGPGAVRILAGIATGVLVHGAFILVVHEAAHGNIFGLRADRWVGALASGALLLPFVAGNYVATHRRHHAYANKPGDNNWTCLRARLYARSRIVYCLYELIPVVSNLDRLGPNRSAHDVLASLLAWTTTGVVVWLAHVDLAWYGSCLVGLTMLNAARLWVEHMGARDGSDRVANTYGGCPLGFGIGHHALHHRHPRIPALILAMGLHLRRHEAHVGTGWWHLLVNPHWQHFSMRGQSVET